MTNCIALIPARSGSKRIPNKNVRLLKGHPLIAYTIQTARDCGIFEKIYTSTDSQEIADIAVHYGSEVPFLRPKEYAADLSPDILWVKDLLGRIKPDWKEYDCFFILRPTSPFRTTNMVKKAWKEFLKNKNVHSLRAVEKCLQHPAKMWIINKNRMNPVICNPKKGDIPWHSMPYQALPEVYVQNASLEISRCSIPVQSNSISGWKIIPYITQEFEGFDLNNESDFVIAQKLIDEGKARLPKITVQPYRKKII